MPNVHYKIYRKIWSDQLIQIMKQFIQRPDYVFDFLLILYQKNTRYTCKGGSSVKPPPSFCVGCSRYGKNYFLFEMSLLLKAWPAEEQTGGQENEMVENRPNVYKIILFVTSQVTSYRNILCDVRSEILSLACRNSQISSSSSLLT